MKIVVTVSKTKTRRAAAEILREVANAIETDRDTCVSGHLRKPGNFTYDGLKGDPDLILAYKYIRL